MPNYRIDYTYRVFGVTTIKAENEDAARDRWENGNYDSGNEDHEDYEITEITSEEELAQRIARQRIMNNQPLYGDLSTGDSTNENHCRVCGNPVEEKDELCDQCWVGKLPTAEQERITRT